MRLIQTRGRRCYWRLENLALAFVLLGMCGRIPTAKGEILPSARQIDWSQAGLPGGIPTRTAVYKRLDDIDKTGVTDVASAIQSALNSCPADQVVLLPAGTFRVGVSLTIPNHVVLRGAGATTVIVANLGSDIIKFYGPFWRFADPIAITSGSKKGSTSMVLASITDVAPGVKVQVQCDNDPATIFPGSEGSGGPWAKGQWIEVTGVSDHTITFNPPLYLDFPSEMNPRLRFPVNGANAQRNFTEYAGVENLTLKNTNAYGNSCISMQFAAYCWVKGITSLDAAVCHVWPLDTFRCEIRDSYFHGVLPPITSSRCYGLQLGTPGGDVPSSKSTATLIENNIWDGNRGHILIGYGASGCVVGYNYFINALSEVPNIQKMDVAFHSSFPMMNLIEGNIGVRGIVADSFHGNSSYNVIFRNWWKGKAPGKDSALCSIELDSYQRYFSAIGNVLGYSGIANDVAALSNPSGQSAYEKVAPASAPYGNFYKAWMIGYDSEGGGSAQTDAQVLSTLIRHGNFDYVTGQTTWSSSISDHNLPKSLYYSAKPNWWPSTLNWPPIGPDLDPMTGDIPASLRYNSIANSAPAAPTGVKVN